MNCCSFRKLLFLVMISTLSFTLLADAIKAPPKRRGRPRRSSQETGGLVFGKAEGNYVRFVNVQDKISSAILFEVAEEVKKNLLLPVEVSATSAGKDIFSIASKTMAMTRTGVAVVVLGAEFDTTILAAPEAGWAIVNVNALLTDNPDTPKAQNRLRKELWRALCFAAGGGFSSMKPCVVQPTKTLSELDALFYPLPSPMQHNAIIDAAKARGVQSIKINTYLGACREGWAPTPTNDIQKAIWEQVKADKERGPTNPLKIPPPKRK